MGTRGFEYHRPDGRRITRPAEIARIARLAIPPAWTDVWICPDPRGHVQATGRDARGRKQFRYHPEWRRTRDETKFDRMLAFAEALPTIRTRTAADLARPGLPRGKVLAAVVQLLAKSFIRVGNEEYARQNGSVGLTTMRDKHVNVRGSTLKFEFRGKSGIRHVIDVDDRRLARIVKRCRALPGQELFQYLDADGRRRKVGSGDVNAYLKEVTGEDFTAKDFRTWAGTVMACTALREMAAARAGHRAADLARSRGAGRRTGKKTGRTSVRMPKEVVQAIDAVAGVLGNTRSVCRNSYIHPAIIDSYTSGSLRTLAALSSSRRTAQGLSPDEAAVVAVLRRMSQEMKKAA
jgi:DNA topoisomerase-1